MGSIVQTDLVDLALADESAGPPYGVLPGSPTWQRIQPNAISKFGPQTKNVARMPISKDLQRLSSKLVDVDSGVDFTCDLTMEHLQLLLPLAMSAKYQGPGKLANGDLYRPTAVSATGYTVAASGDLPDGTLVLASGFSTSGNNGLKKTAGAIAGEITVAGGLTVEAGTGGAAGTAADAKNCTVAVCGVEGAASDLAIDANGDLTSGGGVGPHIDFTTLNLADGQFIWIGGDAAGEQFATAADRGLARIRGTITATKIPLDKKATVFAADAGAGKTIRIFFGRFLHNVAKDDALYQFPTKQAELTLPDLGGVGTDEYWYAKGNAINTCDLEIPLTNIGGMTVGMVGTDCAEPTPSRATNANEARKPVLTHSFSTSSELVRLRATETDETGLTTDFEQATIKMKQSVAGKKVLATTGAKYLNRGLFEADIDCQVLFTDLNLIADLRNSTTVTFDALLRNADGACGVAVDMPSCKLADGAPAFQQHDLVALKCTFAGEEDMTLGYTLSFSLFPYLPTP